MINFEQRIVITHKCNMACPHCFNAEERRFQNTMPYDLLLRFMETYGNKTSRLKIMGGEPLIYDGLEEVIRLAFRKYTGVSLFTNGRLLYRLLLRLRATGDSEILNATANDSFNIIANGFTFREEDLFLCKDLIHRLTLHSVIPFSGHSSVLRKMQDFLPYKDQIIFILSPDTGVDLFDPIQREVYREVWLSALCTILPLLRENGCSFNFDHRLPFCFYNQKMLNRLSAFDLDLFYRRTIGCCGDHTIGLVETDFSLWHCNQTRLRLGSLIVGNNFLPYKQVAELLASASHHKIDSIKSLSEDCSKCPARDVCKVGCYYNVLARNNEILGFQPEQRKSHNNAQLPAIKIGSGN